MVLVGHSMGGLLAKMMILDSGEALWDLVSTRPFSELRATPPQRKLLRRLYFFEPQPFVRRVVFISTPHRGSELGDQFLGRLVDRLIRLPSSVRSTYKALLKQNSADFFATSMRDGLPSSVDNLSRNNPLLMTLQRLPFAAGVPYHSIIGQNAPGPVEEGSDGVVPYVSAHLDGAASELVVHADHSAQDTPDAIGEIRRILMVHLAQVDRGSGVPHRPDVPIAPGAHVGVADLPARRRAGSACRTCSRASMDSGHAWRRKIDPGMRFARRMEGEAGPRSWANLRTGGESWQRSRPLGIRRGTPSSAGPRRSGTSCSPGSAAVRRSGAGPGGTTG